MSDVSSLGLLSLLVVVNAGAWAMPADAQSSTALPGVQGANYIDQHDPVWMRPTLPLSVERYYPIEAQRSGIEGVALLDCGVASNGSLTDCRVAQESPTGMGFGPAAISVVQPNFRMRLTLRSGQPLPSNPRVRFPFRFKMP